MYMSPTVLKLVEKLLSGLSCELKKQMILERGTGLRRSSFGIPYSGRGSSRQTPKGLHSTLWLMPGRAAAHLLCMLLRLKDSLRRFLKEDVKIRLNWLQKMLHIRRSDNGGHCDRIWFQKFSADSERSMLTGTRARDPPGSSGSVKLRNTASSARSQTY